MKKELEYFFQENDNGEVSTEIIWNTLKAVFRGKIISFCANKKKKRQERLINLTKELEGLERKHKKDKDPNVAQQLQEIRKEINNWYDQETEKKILFTKQKCYKTGAKFAKLLARKQQKQKADTTIYKIRDPRKKNLAHKREEIQTIAVRRETKY